MHPRRPARSTAVVAAATKGVRFVVRAEGPHPVRESVIADLHGRMQRAVGGLDDGEDLRPALAHLLRVLGEGTRVERVILVVGAGGDPGAGGNPGAGGDPHEIAAYPEPLTSLDALARVASLVRDVHEAAGSVVADDPAGDGRDRGEEAARARYGVPLFREGRVIAVLVGEAAPPAAIDEAEELAVEAMATLLTPLLLVHQQRQSARELDRLRSDFISRVSHELRTPLTIISGFAGTLGAHDETLTAEQRHEMLDRIVTASVRLDHLVGEMLSLASVDAGLTEARPNLVPVRDMVDLAVHDRGGTGRVEVLGAHTLKVVTDPEIARVVLGSLVENALRHGDRVTVTIEDLDGGARVTVEDDGPGVPSELGARVFERFVRGDDRSPGMGLGLAIARRMAEVIEGRVWHEDVSSGARFVIELRSVVA